MTKSLKSLSAIIVLSLATAGFAFAAEKAASKVGKCCATAAKENRTCAHPCCVEATKAGDNCTKCGGAGKIEKKVEEKK